MYFPFLLYETTTHSYTSVMASSIRTVSVITRAMIGSDFATGKNVRNCQHRLRAHTQPCKGPKHLRKARVNPWTQIVSCLMSHVSCLMSHVSCLMSHVFMQSHVSCLMSHVSCLMSHVSCLMETDRHGAHSAPLIAAHVHASKRARVSSLSHSPRQSPTLIARIHTPA